MVSNAYSVDPNQGFAMRWYGHRQINTRLPLDQFHAVRAEARRRGIPASYVVRELVAARYSAGIEAVSPAFGDNGSELANLPVLASTQPAASAQSILDTLREGMRTAPRAVSPGTAVRDNHGNAAPKVIPSRLTNLRGKPASLMTDVIASANSTNALCGPASRTRD
jgi:hypothetical protein